MKSVILTDAEMTPSLFRWNGSVVYEKLTDLLKTRRWQVPADPLEFWAQTGGGEIFETEVFLPPLVSPIQERGVEQITDWCRARGVAEGLVVFHEGLGFTAVRSEDVGFQNLGTLS